MTLEQECSLVRKGWVRKGGKLRGGCGSLKEVRVPVRGIASDHDCTMFAVITHRTLQVMILIHRLCAKWVEGQYFCFELTISHLPLPLDDCVSESVSEPFLKRIPRPHQIRTGLITFPASMSATASLAALTGYWRSNLSMGNLP